jgi:peptide/nickel transport system substrate-binding protein
MRVRSAVGAVVLVALPLLAGCAPAGSPDATVVATGYCFGSFNADTPAGRAPGSILVRGLTSAGLVHLDGSGQVVEDPSFGTVEKVADDPLTVTYTIADGAQWSDGVPVTPADLLLEWAARSGQLDEIVPLVAGDGTVVLPADADQHVVFGVPSAVLSHASAAPTLDGATLTLVYDSPVADWRTALDVNVPAHVVGRGLVAAATPSVPSPSARTTASEQSSATPPDEEDPAARAVVDAIEEDDRDDLVALSAAWRGYGTVDAVVDDPGRAPTTGPYALVEATGSSVTLRHREDGRTVVVRCDLDPLDQVAAVKDGAVDLAVPIPTDDVRAAARDAGLVTTEGTGAVLQLQLDEHPGSPFAGDQAMRSAFLGSLDPVQVADAADAIATDVVLAQLGAAVRLPAATDDDGADEDVEDDGADRPVMTEGVEVRLLVDVDDPVRAALAQEIVRQSGLVGFHVTLVPGSTVALWSQPGLWDAALVPVVQESDPVAAVVARWRSGGGVDVTGHADPVLDGVLDSLAAQPDRDAQVVSLAQVEDLVEGADVVLPLVLQPQMAVVAPGSGLETPPFTWSAVDVRDWWSWLDRADE